MTDYSMTERPSPLSLFDKPWSDRPPAPIPLRPSLRQRNKEAERAAQAELAAEFRARQAPRRPKIGAYELSDLDAGFRRCRYPTGDGPFLFCGAAVDAGCYCGRHARIAFR